MKEICLRWETQRGQKRRWSTALVNGDHVQLIKDDTDKILYNCNQYHWLAIVAEIKTNLL